MRRRPRHARLTAYLLASAAVMVGTVGFNAAYADEAPVTIQVLNVSDYHGQIVPLGNGVGGAPALAAYFAQARAENPRTLTLTAGDGVGATPPVSSLFADEPTIRAMRLMHFDADTLGNHNFDGGLARLQKQIDLARTGDPAVPGTKFRYLSANLANVDANLKGVEKMRMFEVGDVKVAVIGLTNPEAPGLVFPGNFGTITITDPVAAANKQRAIARKAGARVVIALIHAGVTGADANGQAFGPLVDFASGVSGFDLILGDHTDLQYEGRINGALVTENRSKGLTYSRVSLTVDKKRGVTTSSVAFATPTANAVTPDPTVAALVDGYSAQLQPILGTVIGSSTKFIPRGDSCGTANGRTCESLIGDVTTDAMRARYGTDFAITNSGGLRDNLTCPVDGKPGTGFCPALLPPPNLITRGQVFAVLPFGNVATTTTLSGAELKTFLENGISLMPRIDGRFPQVSGLCFRYDIGAPVGSRVLSAVRQAADGSCTGAPVDLTAAATYSIASNDFMATGGDGYPVVFGRSVTRDLLDQVLADQVAANSPLSPVLQGRITCVDLVNPTDAVVCPAPLP